MNIYSLIRFCIIIHLPGNCENIYTSVASVVIGPKITTLAFFLFLLLAMFFFGPTLYVEPPRVNTEDMQAVADANNQFALELYPELDGENVFFSPFSISTALAMTHEGARGETAEEMQNVLHFPDEEVRRPAFAEIYDWANRKHEGYEFRVGNSLWAQKDFPFLTDYFDIIKKYYGGEITNVDFRTDPEGVRHTINDWVEDKTNNRIKDLIPPGILTPITRLVLTNAIYFKGTWVKQFDKEGTMESDFRTTPGETVSVQMMSMDGESFRYAETDEFQLLELPYEGDELSMLVILPKENWLEALENIDSRDMSEFRTILTEQEVKVFLPKFKLETKYFMKSVLAGMGMPTAFSGAADFSGMTGGKDLAINEVIHQAFVEVDEEGTEAAAATAVVMELTSVGPSKPVFRADHPFMFVIQEKETGGILFLGRVSNPSR